MANLAPSWRPKRLQNRSGNPKKTMLKNNTFSASISEGFGPRFGRVLGRFFRTKMHRNCKNMILAKTLKIVLPSRRNANFQEIDVAKRRKKHTQINDNLHGFWGIDFSRIWGGFWEDFGRPKSLIFAFFSMFFRSIFPTIFRRPKNRKK